MTKYSGKQLGRMLKVNRRMGALLKEARIEAQLKPRHIAKVLNIPIVEVLRWEAGFGTLPAAAFGKLVEYFSDESQWRLQLLMTSFQRERHALNAVESPSKVLVINFDALGVVQALKRVA
jgi:hypothetical protein